MDFLNKNNFKILKYKFLKIDLILDLLKGYVWLSGVFKDFNGISFNLNILIEEIFGMLYKFKVNGIVYSIKFFVYGGNIIDNFFLIFKDGKIIDFFVEKGLDILEKFIEMDEGFYYLGEVVFVLYNLLIFNMDIIFYNILYDENVFCYFVIGFVYKICLEGGNNLKDEELDEYGVNDSLIYVDFMIGFVDMDIIGEIYDGK